MTFGQYLTNLNYTQILYLLQKNPPKMPLGNDFLYFYSFY